ncbi:hypothetical protein AMTRI_Chr01g102330 [Amborella trichopoda]
MGFKARCRKKFRGTVRFLTLAYSTSGAGRDDLFYEYDPTPYDGGYDPDLTFGKPLPASKQTCYSPSKYSSSSFENFDYGSLPSPYGDSQPAATTTIAQEEKEERPTRDEDSESHHDPGDSHGNGIEDDVLELSGPLVNPSHGDGEEQPVYHGYGWPWPEEYGYGYGYGSTDHGFRTSPASDYWWDEPSLFADPFNLRDSVPPSQGYYNGRVRNSQQETEQGGHASSWKGAEELMDAIFGSSKPNYEYPAPERSGYDQHIYQLDKHEESSWFQSSYRYASY